MRPSDFLIIFICFWLVVFCGNFLFFTNIGKLLCRVDPPCKVDVIICLSTNFRVQKAVSLFREGYAPRIIFTVQSTRKKALEYGIAENAALGPTQDAQSTFQEALYTKKLLQKYGFHSAMVVSDPFHLYRVRWTFEKLCDDLPVTFSFIGTEVVRPCKDWWKNKRDRHFVLTEIPKILYYRLYHGLFRIDDDPGITKKMKTWYSRMLWKMDQNLKAWEMVKD